jgi:hypothetical protein
MIILAFLVTLTLRVAALNGRAISKVKLVCSQTKNLGGKTKWVQVSNIAKLWQ